MSGRAFAFSRATMNHRPGRLRSRNISLRIRNGAIFGFLRFSACPEHAQDCVPYWHGDAERLHGILLMPKKSFSCLALTHEPLMQMLHGSIALEGYCARAEKRYFQFNDGQNER